MNGHTLGFCPQKTFCHPRFDSGSQRVNSLSLSQGGNESETKAVFIISSPLLGETLNLIQSVVQSSDFQHCTVFCTVPEYVHSFASHTDMGEVSPFGEISVKLREWMGNMVF